MPLAEKKDAGNIYTDLHIIRKEQSSAGSGYDTIIPSVPDQGKDFLPNFRIGDMVYLYTYKLKEEPDVRKAILYKGVLQEIHSDEIVVHLTDGQQNADIFEMNLPYAIEHGTSDASTGGSIRNLHQFICAPKEKRDLLLGQRAPQRDASLTLTRHYDDVLDDIILRAKQAQDYFLLVGPPGTGKTSRALKFMVEEALNDGTGMPTAESIASGGKTAQQPASSILPMSYTNRAVDEICEMLVDSGIPFLRLGSEYSCDERFRPYLIEKAISDCPKLEAIKQYIIGTRVIVGTTSMMTSKPFIFLLKHFKLAIIDESSQILEPNLIGLLSAVDKFILIGDYKQLPAVVQQSEQDSGIPTINDSQKGGIIDMSILQDICLTNCRNSLFERLIHWEDYEERSEFIGILRRQGRMHPEIAEFPNRMFYRREKLEPVPCPHQLETELSYTLPSEDALDDLLKEHRMIFLPSKFCKEPNVSDKDQCQRGSNRGRPASPHPPLLWRAFRCQEDGRRHRSLPQPDSHGAQRHRKARHSGTGKNQYRYRRAVPGQPARCHHLQFHHPEHLAARLPCRQQFRRRRRHHRPQAERSHHPCPKADDYDRQPGDIAQ